MFFAQFPKKHSWQRLLSRGKLMLCLCLVACSLVACGGITIGPKPQVNLTPLTPAAPVPLAQLKWCSGASPTEVQPSFAIQLPPTLSPDYCLNQASASSTDFSLEYHHNYYNNGFSIREVMYPLLTAQQGLFCGTGPVGVFQPVPSEPYPHGCSLIQGKLHISLAGPEAEEDLKIQLRTLQPNVAFLPA